MYFLYSTVAVLLSLAYNSFTDNALIPAEASTIDISSPPADTLRFPATYATSLPRPTPAQWEQDYALYERFLTPDIRRTQAGLSFVRKGVQIWWCQNSAIPHAQLDTTTRISDATRLIGGWRSVINRVVTHIDSFSVADQKFYRSAHVTDLPGDVTLRITAQQVTLQTSPPKPQHFSRKYSLINQRYLLFQGALTAGGGISQVGLDAEGRLLLYTCAVTERKVPSEYLTYQTTIRQSIFAHE